MPISFNLFVNQDSRLYLSNPFSLSQPNPHLSTYICSYFLSIHLYFLIPLYHTGLMPISLYLFVNPDSRLYLSNPFSLSQIFLVCPSIFVSISCLSTFISLYLFVNLDWCLSLYISLLIQIHGYHFQPHFLYLSLFLIYPPIFVSISCPSTSIS